MGAPAVPVRSAPRRGTVDPVLLLPLAVAGGLLATQAALSGGLSDVRAAIDLALAWAFAGAAALALARPSTRRAGWLMAGIAAAWFLEELQRSSSPLAWTAGLLLAWLPVAMVVALVVSFPGGRVWSWPARAVLAGAFLVTVGRALLGALFLPDGRNLLLVSRNQGVVDTVNHDTTYLGLVVTFALAVLIVLRLRSLRGVARRATFPLLGGTLLMLPFFAVWFGAYVLGESGFGDRLEDTVRLSVVLVPLGFLAGVVWTRLRRSNVSSLVVELHEGGVDTLRDRLAQALGDPTLEIAYWLEQTGTYADAAGRPYALPDDRTRAVTHVLAGGAPVAALIHDPALLEERDLVESVRATAGLVLENERLAAEVRAQLEEVRASRARIVAAADEERRRLERDLHDGAQQRLVALSLKLALARTEADPVTGASLDHAREDVEQALAELREFARGVHPSVLREDGLDSAVEALARRAPLPVEIIGTARGRLPDPIELAAYFFVSEALTNVAKHARATHATVTIEREQRRLTLAVADDGIGGANASRGSGLAGLSDRLAALDGTLMVQAEPGAGTKLVATISCDS
jgi:signal transduction histidine kinase